MRVAVCCSVFQCVAVCCSVLQCVAVRADVVLRLGGDEYTRHGVHTGKMYACCSALQCVAVCCSMLQCVAVFCSMLKCAAVCCSVLQCVAVRVSVVLRLGGDEFTIHGVHTCKLYACCSVVQYVAVCSSMLQCVAVCCSVLQCGLALSCALEETSTQYKESTRVWGGYDY